MSDHDATLLEDAASAVLDIDLRYRRANIDEKEDLKPARDEAFNAYSAARLKLLQEGVIATQEDVDEMKAIRGEISRAADIQGLVVAAERLAVLLARFA
jgi:hypothetical protein